jgi:hypothetical protein
MHPNEIRVARRTSTSARLGSDCLSPLWNAKAKSGHLCCPRYTVTPRRRCGRSSIATIRGHLPQGKSFLTALRRGVVITRLARTRAIWPDDAKGSN